MTRYVKQRFSGFCPYIEIFCKTLECETCEVEADEQFWAKEQDEVESEG